MARKTKVGSFEFFTISCLDEISSFNVEVEGKDVRLTNTLNDLQASGEQIGLRQEL